MENRVYINLTFGAFSGLKACGVVRIQSTWLEQKRWGEVLEDLDYGFLLDYALGANIYVVDCSKRKMSRALWQGLPWIRYACTRSWTGEELKTVVRGHVVTEYFHTMYSELDNRPLAKLRYLRRYYSPGGELIPFPIRMQEPGNMLEKAPLLVREALGYEV